MSDQLELFDLASQQSPQPRRDTLGRLLVNLRYDQLALACIGVLLSLTVVFACGVERGKHLAKAEQLWPGPEQSRNAPTKTARAPEPPARIAQPPTPMEPEAASQPAGSDSSLASAVKKAKRPDVGVKSTVRSRYAVQVRTYTQPQMAKGEMDRLHARGESAFLVMRDGRTAVYVGPFPSKIDAVEKVGMLRTRYQDCFVKTL